MYKFDIMQHLSCNDSHSIYGVEARDNTAS